MGVKLYFTTVSSTKDIKANQARIKNVLDSKKIDYEEIDISTDAALKDQMRAISGNPTQLPPYITNDNEPCGDYEAFELAVEDGILDKFLKLA